MKLLKVVFFSLIAMIFTMNVNAASGSINVSSSTKTAVVGSTFTVTVKVSCSEALGSWKFGLSYDSAYISLQSGDTTVAAYGDGSTKVKTYTYKFKAIKSGNASIRVTSASMVSWNDVDTLFTPSISNTSVTIKTQKEIEASYSKDNNLKSLSIDGFEIVPAFSKDTTEYSVEIPDNIETINVSAKPNDGRSSIKGTGSIDVSEGSNKVDVVVTAQNGATKTYTITVIVKDLHPIEVHLAGKTLSVVKKAELLSCPTGYTPKTIKINDIDVPAFVSEITNFVLVGLKEESGEVKLFRYDEGNYYIYNELKSKGLILYPEDAKEIPSGFQKSKAVINDIEITVYTNKSIGKNVLVYGLNVENGYQGFYIYDKDDSSFIRFDDESLKETHKKERELKLAILALAVIVIILFFITIIVSSKLSKMKKILSKKITKKEEKRADKQGV